MGYFLTLSTATVELFECIAADEDLMPGCTCRHLQLNCKMQVKRQPLLIFIWSLTNITHGMQLCLCELHCSLWLEKAYLCDATSQSQPQREAKLVKNRWKSAAVAPDLSFTVHVSHKCAERCALLGVQKKPVGFLLRNIIYRLRKPINIFWKCNHALLLPQEGS